MKFRRLSVTILTAVVACAIILAGCSGSNNKNSGGNSGSNSGTNAGSNSGANAGGNSGPIYVGWTNDTENSILGNLVTILLEDKLGLDVRTSANLGGTGLAHQAIIEGKIDIYPDYTGDALANVLKQEPATEPDKAYEAVKSGYLEKYDITWLDPTPFNNTYALAIKREIAESLNIYKISDLAAHASDWKIGSSVEFSVRELDGYPGMIKHYGFEFKEIRPMDIGLMYTAIDSDEVDVIVAFATDARIGKLNLVVLEDDKFFFPSYNAAPTIRNEVLNAHPEIADALNEVFSSLDTETMIALNGQVDMDNKDPAEVARNYLVEKGFIE